MKRIEILVVSERHFGCFILLRYMYLLKIHLLLEVDGHVFKLLLLRVIQVEDVFRLRV